MDSMTWLWIGGGLAWTGLTAWWMTRLQQRVAWLEENSEARFLPVPAGTQADGLVRRMAELPVEGEEVEDASQELIRLASVKMKELGIPYRRAADLVLKTNPDLAGRYQDWFEAANAEEFPK